jgi:intein/homing endonuclease
MDNQQEIDTAYFGGIMDGEGCFTLGLSSKKNGTKQINPTIQVTNTNQIILDFVLEFLSKFNITHHVKWYQPTQRCKPYATIAIHRRESMQKFLQIILPYLRGKKRQAELMLEYVNRRIEVSNTAQRNTNSWRYEERDWEIARQIQALNKKGRENLNDYTLDTLRGDDIVCSATKVAVNNVSSTAH